MNPSSKRAAEVAPRPITVPRGRRAMLAGARLEAVAAALGSDLEVAFDRWREWAIVQRDIIVSDKPGITAEEYHTVASRFAALGLRPGR